MRVWSVTTTCKNVEIPLRTNPRQRAWGEGAARESLWQRHIFSSSSRGAGGCAWRGFGGGLESTVVWSLFWVMALWRAWQVSDGWINTRVLAHTLRVVALLNWEIRLERVKWSLLSTQPASGTVDGGQGLLTFYVDLGRMTVTLRVYMSTNKLIRTKTWLVYCC